MTVQVWPFTLVVEEVPTPAGFLGTIDPVAQTVPVGTVATYQVAFADVDPGFAVMIDLAVLGLPAEAVTTWSVNPAAATDVVTLTIETDLMAAGEYAAEIEATYDW